jgi:four helix bundle protein
MKTHKDLEVWRGGIKLVEEIYQLTKHFPKEEIYGMISQIRRAAVSVPANISEGAARNQTKDFIRFLRISQGSLSEVETLLYISVLLGYLQQDQIIKPEERIKKLTNQLIGLINALTRNYL